MHRLASASVADGLRFPLCNCWNLPVFTKLKSTSDSLLLLFQVVSCQKTVQTPSSCPRISQAVSKEGGGASNERQLSVRGGGKPLKCVIQGQDSSAVEQASPPPSQDTFSVIWRRKIWILNRDPQGAPVIRTSLTVYSHVIDSLLKSKIVCCVRAVLVKYCHRWSSLKASVVDYVACLMLHHRHVVSECIWIRQESVDSTQLFSHPLQSLSMLKLSHCW